MFLLIIRSIADVPALCKLIIDWKKQNLFPIEIFGLPESYKKDDILAKYKDLSRRFHPDKNPEITADATSAFQLLGAAKDYLLFTIGEYTEDISNNVFYQAEPATTQKYNEERRFSGLLKIFADRPNNQWVVNELKKIILKKKELLQRDSGPPLYKTALYLASELNQVEFFQWLLQQGADPALKQEFGLTSIDVAIINGHTPILESIIAKYGKDWLENKLNETLVATKNCRVVYKTLDYINKHFSPKTQDFIKQRLQENPYLIPNLSTLGYITMEEEIRLLHSKIKEGMLDLYGELFETQRRNLDLLVAVLSQKRTKEQLKSIPFSNLPRHLVFALLDIWPDIASFSKFVAGTPYTIKNSPDYLLSSRVGLIVIAVMILIWTTVLTVALVFYPASTLVFSMSFGVGLAMMLYSAINSTLDAIKKYQYKSKIKASLESNGLFKPTPDNVDPEGLRPGYVK